MAGPSPFEDWGSPEQREPRAVFAWIGPVTLTQDQIDPELITWPPKPVPVWAWVHWTDGTYRRVDRAEAVAWTPEAVRIAWEDDVATTQVRVCSGERSSLAPWRRTSART